MLRKSIYNNCLSSSALIRSTGLKTWECRSAVGWAPVRNTGARIVTCLLAEGDGCGIVSWENSKILGVAELWIAKYKATTINNVAVRIKRSSDLSPKKKVR